MDRALDGKELDEKKTIHSFFAPCNRYALVAAKLQCPVENAAVRMWQQGDEQACDATASLVTSGGLFPATTDPAEVCSTPG